MCYVKGFLKYKYTDMNEDLVNRGALKCVLMCTLKLDRFLNMLYHIRNQYPKPMFYEVK